MDLLSRMSTFVRVVEAGSLSAAARGLRLSLPAVSRQLRSLEEEVGAPLVLRTTRKLAITDAGRLYYERCARILREVEEAQELFHAQREVGGKLSVTAPVTLGLLRISPHLPALLERHPTLRVELRLEDHVADLVEEGVDVAIRAGIAAPDSTSVIAHPLMSYRRVLVASPQYLKKRGEPREPSALARYELLPHMPAVGSSSPWRFTRDGREVTVEVSGALRTSSLLVIRDATLQGLGIAHLPEWVTETDITAGRLRPLLTDWASPLVTVVAIHRAELRGSPRLKVFLEHLRGTISSPARPEKPAR